jgi:hypothetical protein
VSISDQFAATASFEDLVADTHTLLAAGEIELALAEQGLGGELARLLAGGPVTKAVNYGRPEELLADLRVSPAKIAAYGVLSGMVAAEAAAALIDTYEGGWGLVVIAPARNQASGSDVKSEGEPTQSVVALGTPSTTIVQHCLPEETVRATFVLLHEQARRRLAAR